MWDLYIDGAYSQTAHKPASITDALGRVVLSPNAMQLNAAGWYEVSKPLQEGLVALGWIRAGIVDGRSLYAPIATYTADEVEVHRVAALAADNMTAIVTLGGLLATFGLSIPIDEEVVASAVYAATKADSTLSADAQLLQRIHANLLDVMTNDDIAAVAAYLQGAQA